MPECQIFRVFNYRRDGKTNLKPCDSWVSEQIVVSLRKHGRVQISVVAGEPDLKDWVTAMIAELHSLRFPEGEEFEKLDVRMTEPFRYVLSVKVK